jgi:hypothetical protein
VNQTHPLVIAASETLLRLAALREEARAAGASWGTWEPVDRANLARHLAVRFPRRQSKTLAAAVDYLIDTVNLWHRDLGALHHMESVGSDKRRLDDEIPLFYRGPLTAAVATALSRVWHGVSPLIRPMNITLYNQEMERYARDCREISETRRNLPGLIAALAVEVPAAASILEDGDIDKDRAGRAIERLRVVLATLETIP